MTFPAFDAGAGGFVVHLERGAKSGGDRVSGHPGTFPPFGTDNRFRIPHAPSPNTAIRSTMTRPLPASIDGSHSWQKHSGGPLPRRAPPAITTRCGVAPHSEPELIGQPERCAVRERMHARQSGWETNDIHLPRAMQRFGIWRSSTGGINGQRCHSILFFGQWTQLHNAAIDWVL